MRVVRTATLATALVLTALGGQAKADDGVGIGPARQLVVPGQETATVIVSNPTDENIRVLSSPFYHDGSGWVEDTRLEMFFEPARFRLKAGTQQEVLVILPDVSEKCSLLGAGFEVKIDKLRGQVQASAVGIAQFAVQGTKQSTEQDCLNVLPVPSATPAPDNGTAGEIRTGTIIAWLLIALVLLLGYAIYRLGKRAGRPRKGTAHGF